MSDPIAWRSARADLGVDPGHAAYRTAALVYGLGAEIRSLREQRGWSQTELARRAGMTQPEVDRFESGGAVPTLPTLDRIAGALQMRVSISLSPA